MDHVNEVSEWAARARFADPVRTTRARIRDAAIARFATDGVVAANLQTIAADAGVASASLVIYHFGSKDGLRAACDEYVARAILTGKGAAIAAGSGLDPLRSIRDAQQGPPLLKYLARTLVDGSSYVAALVDALVDDVAAHLAGGVDAGLLEPTEHPRERAVVLVLWQLGALVLYEHAERLLGVDLTGVADDFRAWTLPAAETLARGAPHESRYDGGATGTASRDGDIHGYPRMPRAPVAGRGGCDRMPSIDGVQGPEPMERRS